MQEVKMWRRYATAMIMINDSVDAYRYMIAENNNSEVR
jgi:hypothetical protein